MASHYIICAIAWLVYIGYQRIDATAYIVYSWEFSAASLYIWTPCFLWSRIDCHHYIFISRQLSDIYWIQPAVTLCYSSHFGAYICDAEPFRAICIIRDTPVDLYLDLCIRATLWFDDKYIYIYIWELEYQFSISTLVATRTTNGTYSGQRTKECWIRIIHYYRYYFITDADPPT